MMIVRSVARLIVHQLHDFARLEQIRVVAEARDGVLVRRTLLQSNAQNAVEILQRRQDFFMILRSQFVN